MSLTTYGEISLLELVPLFARYARLVVVLIFTILLYPISGQSYSLKRTLWRTYVQAICPDSTLRQMQWICPKVGVLYEKYIHKRNGHLDVIHEDVGEGASLHWIGPKSSTRVMLFFHGGGYVLPALYAHFAMVDYWRTEVKKLHIDMSVAVLEYSLVNFAPWPQQLRQVVSAFTHLLKGGIMPSNIILVGDSVGGHQIAFLLGHLLHPHPAAPSIPVLSSPIAGAAMLSPWLTFSETAPSYITNASTDLMPTPTLRKWADLLKRSRETTDDGNWFEPHNAPPNWWHGLDTFVSKMLFTTGSCECMFDDIVETMEKMDEGSRKELQVECFVQVGGAHNEALSEFACGDKPGPTNEKVTKWIANVFG